MTGAVLINSFPTAFTVTGERTMLSTRIELKSKEACSVCGEHKLYTNDSEKNDEVVRWHCLNCNHTFSENVAEKKARKQKEKEQKKDQPSGVSGITMIALILIAILMVTLSQEQESTQETAQPATQSEQLN